MGFLLLPSASRLTKSKISAVPTPMMMASPSGKSSISKPAMGKPIRGSINIIHMHPIEDFLFSCATASSSGELYLSEKPTMFELFCGDTGESSCIGSMGTAIFKFIGCHSRYKIYYPQAA